MYEEKTRRNIQINWKSLLIKLGILLVVIFLVIWIVSLFNRDEEVTSNFGVNLELMREASTEYFTGSRLPSEIDESTSITLGEMFERNLLIEFQDEHGNPCDTENSYAEATKLDDENYRIEIRLVCENESDTIINTVQRQNATDTDSDDDALEQPDEEEPNDSDDEDNSVVEEPSEEPTDNNQSNSSNNTNNNQSNNSTSNNNSSSNNSSNNSNNNNSNNNTSNGNTQNNNKPTTTVCNYGKKEYSTVYPLAYVVSGNCAVSSSSISGTHANYATRIGNTEYLKLVKEMQDLEKRTGVEITVSTPKYSQVLNKAGTGYVGYQIYFVAKEQISTYSAKAIYAYYLDEDGNRTVIIDSRNSLGNSDNNNNNDDSMIPVTSVTLNRSSLTLDVGDTYNLSVTICPTNATNKSVTWSSSNKSVATVSSSGKITAKKAGTTTITAKVGNMSDTVKVTVHEDDIAVTSVEINRNNLSLYVGDVYTFYVTINPSNATNKSVTWSSSNSNVVSISSSGKITAKRAGSATITATVDGKSDRVNVYVLDEVETYTKTYYLMSYISPSLVGVNYVQEFIFTDIDRDADILSLDVDYYSGIRDFNAYVETKDESKNIEVYNGYDKEGYLQMIGANNLYNSSLDSSNFKYTYTKLSNLNGYYGVRINTNIYNATGVSLYSNSYFVPLKVTVTYEE